MAVEWESCWLSFSTWNWGQSFRKSSPGLSLRWYEYLLRAGHKKLSGIQVDGWRHHGVLRSASHFCREKSFGPETTMKHFSSASTALSLTPDLCNLDFSVDFIYTVPHMFWGSMKVIKIYLHQITSHGSQHILYNGIQVQGTKAGPQDLCSDHKRDFPLHHIL